MTVVAVCEVCGGLVLDTQPRVSAHGPLNYGAYIGGGEFDALQKQSGYVPNAAYGTGGRWEPPRLLHLACSEASS